MRFQPVMVQAQWALVLIFSFLALPKESWPGLVCGVILFWALWRSHYREGFAWFSSLPGLYHFLGVEATQESLLAAFGAWGLVSFGLLLLSLTVSSASRGARFPVLYLLPLIALRPEGYMLGIVLLIQSLWTLTREASLSGQLGRRWVTTPKAPAGLLAAAVVLAAGASLAPLGIATDSPPPSKVAEPGAHAVKPPAPAEPRSEPGLPEGGNLASSKRARAVSTQTNPLPLLDIFIQVTLALAVLVLGIAFVLAVRARARGQPLLRGHLMPLLVASFGLGMLLAWFQLSRGDAGAAEGPVTALPRAPGGSADQTVAPGGSSALPVLDAAAVVGLLAALAAVVVLSAVAWSLARQLKKEPSHPSEASPRRGEGEKAASASRIRRAYQQFLRLMEQRGYPRTVYESPREYATRLGKHSPAVHAELHELTGLYEPVRYGGYADEAQAERAERLAELVPDAFSYTLDATGDQQREKT